MSLAIALAYVMMNKNDPLEAVAPVIRTYTENFPLEIEEINYLYYMIVSRLCISLLTSSYKRFLDPENPHLFTSEEGAWNLVEKLLTINPVKAQNQFREAAGMISETQFTNGYNVDLLNKRKRLLGPSLSISYKKPLHIIGGALQYLYDSAGETYLDCVNNVSHVGHCNPSVVRRGQKEMARLNTNTRYLHENIINYAEKLLSTFPESLEVCYFVCSGSEANDLALRIARNYTQQEHVIVIDGAYHGTTISDIEISPYKNEGPGGKGAPEFIHKLSSPDLFRGKYRKSSPHPGLSYAEEADELIKDLEKKGYKIAAFIHESLLGCAGQIELPEGYLKEVYRIIKAAGGLNIADEVQVGFGRVGSHFWGFQTQDVDT